MLENVGSNTFIEEARYLLQNDGIIIGDSIGHRLQKQIDFIGSETPCKQKMLLQVRFYEVNFISLSAILEGYNSNQSISANFNFRELIISRIEYYRPHLKYSILSNRNPGQLAICIQSVFFFQMSMGASTRTLHSGTCGGRTRQPRILWPLGPQSSPCITLKDCASFPGGWVGLKKDTATPAVILSSRRGTTDS